MKDEHRAGVENVSRRAGAWVLLLTVPVALAGCGTNMPDLLYQTATAAGRVYLDQLLTDVVNAVAERAEQRDANALPSDDGEAGEDEADVIDDDSGAAGGGGSPFENLTGDPAAGEPLYASCAACHCADATGGCIAGASGLVGGSAETLDQFLRGDAPHPSSDLSDQEIVDLEAYLASLGG